MSPRSTAGVLSSRPDAPWLPPGGRADVVLAAPRAAPPAPICTVRLLVTRGQDLLTVVRGDGRGLDIPSVRADGSPEERLQALIVAPPMLTSPCGTSRFAAGSEGRGRWLDVGEAREELQTRHWWPLAAHVLEGQQPVRP